MGEKGANEPNRVGPDGGQGGGLCISAEIQPGATLSGTVVAGNVVSGLVLSAAGFSLRAAC